MTRAPAADQEIPGFLAELGIPGIVDAHVHFMPERVQAAVWRWFDELAPAWPVTYRSPSDDRLATLARLGVRHHTALAYAHRPGMLAFLNDYTLQLADSQPAVIASFTIYPEPGAAQETQRCLRAGGRCVKVHLQVGAFDPVDPLLDESWALLQDAGTAVVIHAGAVADGSGNEQWCGPEPLRRLLARFPRLRLVVAHLGAPEYEEFIELAEQHPGVWLDTAMVFGDPPHLGLFPRRLVPRLARLGGRIAFGSDFPTIPQPLATQLRGLTALGLGDPWLRDVLWHNGLRLFDLSD